MALTTAARARAVLARAHGLSLNARQQQHSIAHLHRTPLMQLLACTRPAEQRGLATISQENNVAEQPDKRRDDSVEGILAGLVEGDRYALARAITLIESSNPKHRVQAQRLLSKILERESSLASQQSKSLASVTPSPQHGKASTPSVAGSGPVSEFKAESGSAQQRDLPVRLGKSYRIGLSGPPGVGKSTFIESFGMYLLSKGHRVSVLAVDPSSARTGGSILGDKTRMTELSRSTMAYVRPSPSRGTLGGVARNTTEAITLCEAAGYDICLVETVGVGQSETMVADIVDMFVLLVPPAGGDELQGMKKGIMELSDLVIVNKSDGALVDSARYAQIEYTSALKFVKAVSEHWKPKVIRVSSMGGPEGGIEQAWNTMKEYFDIMESAGELQKKRGNQRKIWMWRQVSSELLDRLNEDEQVRKMAHELEAKVLQNEVMSGAAAHQIVERFMKGMSSS
ncbi:methylmalonic aciduria type A protein, mitochondrial [Dissophora ornata]|nr:methylmalonic aciduria type A protein, mitochondrial [Dissophora ornata]